MREALGEAFARRPVLRRIAGYSAGSVVAATTSELAFLVVLGWLHAGTTWASAAGFAGGAIPNYVLNRRWAWSERRGRDRRAEMVLYVIVALSTFAASAVATHWVERGARSVTGSHGWTVVLTGLAYLGVSGVLFVAKFVLYERVVFIPGSPASGGHRVSEPTT